MRVLLLHNQYRQHGGEDAVVKSEARMLRQMGVEVLESTFSNEVDPAHSLRGTLRLGLRSSWSRDSYRRIQRLCDDFRPDIAHVHNFWMEMSPSVHRACREWGATTVQTLHNFRLLCANALLKRDGAVCEDCLGKLPWRGVLRSCYRDSVFASLAVSRMIVSNRVRGTWERDVDAFIALSEHSREKFIEGNLPGSKILVKPNFVEDPGEAPSLPSASNTVLYAGRLSEEKGVKVLISAWAHGKLGGRARLVIAGDGPERAALEFHAAALNLRAPEVVFVGEQRPEQVMSLMANARVLVMPSLFFECFPRTLGEGLAWGRPVIVSQIGALSEIVSDNFGLRFPASNHALLARAISTIVEDGELADRLGRAGRQEYLARYTPEQNSRALMRIYRFAIQQRGKRLPAELEDVQPIGITI
jgi:glycosyltransferase involved in cell wall biosynthesis